jgi:hypothetical protein
MSSKTAPSTVHGVTATPSDILLAVLTVALKGMSVDSRDLASLHCVRVLCEYLSYLNVKKRVHSEMPLINGGDLLGKLRTIDSFVPT